MKIALEFKKNTESTIERLKEHGYEISKSTYNTYWVHGLRYAIIKGGRVELSGNEKNPYPTLVEMEDLNYLEIYNEK